MVRKNNIDLREYNSFGIGAVARTFIEFDSVADLQTLHAEGLFEGDVRVIGAGNNIIFVGDADCTLLHPVAKGIEVVSRDSQSVTVRAEAGTDWDDFVAWCVAQGLWGAENLSLIPGAVGAAPVQNIGAYGVEAKDIISSVEMFCTDTAKVLTLAAEHCDFGYRESIFKHTLKGKVVITAVTFTLSLTPNPNCNYGDLAAKVQELGGATLENIRAAVIDIRQSKLPDPKVMGNVGSFFKNPFVSTQRAKELAEQYEGIPLYATEGGVKVAAGWLIDRCGLKGYRAERVGVHERQALVLVNLGGATGEDVIELATMVRQRVKEKFGIDIEMEVNVWGF